MHSDSNKVIINRHFNHSLLVLGELLADVMCMCSMINIELLCAITWDKGFYGTLLLNIVMCLCKLVCVLYPFDSERQIYWTQAHGLV